LLLLLVWLDQTVVLLTSSLTMVMAHAAIEDENRRRAKLYLGLTVLGGLMFLGFKAIEYTTEISNGFTPPYLPLTASFLLLRKTDKVPNIPHQPS
jgi:heme/copper-type cytochrome/quinol oxidase subunit 3